jgi:hypothetical protein
VTTYHPAPETTCLRCGITYHDARDEGWRYGNRPLCARLDAAGEIAAEWPTHQWTAPLALSLDDLIATILGGLESGRSTDDIAVEVGIEYNSILRRLRRAGATQILRRLGTARTAEWERRRPFIPTRAGRFYRCAHGWWSTDGACHHEAVNTHELALKRHAARLRA